MGKKINERHEDIFGMFPARDELHNIANGHVITFLFKTVARVMAAREDMIIKYVDNVVIGMSDE